MTEIMKAENVKIIYKCLMIFDYSATRSINSRVGNLRQYAVKLSENAECFVAWSGGNITGFVSVYINDNNKAYMPVIAVKKNYKRQGIGRQLLNIVLCQAREKELRYLELEVDKDNQTAIRFYVKNGFSISKEASSQSYYMQRRI